MGRLKVITPPELSAEQREVWSAVTRGSRAAAHERLGGLVGADGGLVGPFNAWLYSPTVGLPAATLGEAVRFHCSFGPRLSEIAILTVAAHWRSNFEFAVHCHDAEAAGLSRQTLDDIAAGSTVDGLTDEERVIVQSCRELLSTGRFPDDLYAAATNLLGVAGVVELVTLIGYYTLAALNLNAFEVSAPPGTTARWPG